MNSQVHTLGGGATAATSGSSQAQSCLCDSSLFSLKWGDYLYACDYAQKMQYVVMPQEQWERGVAGHLAAHPHNWAVRQWVGKMEMQRKEYAERTRQWVSIDVPDSDELDLRIWKDMIEEPCKYGDDIVEWLELDKAVTKGPKRWRAGAFWTRKAAEETEREQKMMAVRIQAAWRGYATRCRLQEESDIEELTRVIREGIKEEPWKYDGDSVMMFLELDNNEDELSVHGTWPSDVSDSEDV